jgi:hypothetical protein
MEMMRQRVKWTRLAEEQPQVLELDSELALDLTMLSLKAAKVALGLE